MLLLLFMVDVAVAFVVDGCSYGLLMVVPMDF